MTGLGHITREDWALIGGWRPGPDQPTPRDRRRILIGRLQREMNARARGDGAAHVVVVDGCWGPRSDALYRHLTRNGSNSFDDFMAPEVTDAILEARGEKPA